MEKLRSDNAPVQGLTNRCCRKVLEWSYNPSLLKDKDCYNLSYLAGAPTKSPLRLQWVHGILKLVEPHPSSAGFCPLQADLILFLLQTGKGRFQHFSFLAEAATKAANWLQNIHTILKLIQAQVFLLPLLVPSSEPGPPIFAEGQVLAHCSYPPFLVAIK